MDFNSPELKSITRILSPAHLFNNPIRQSLVFDSTSSFLPQYCQQTKRQHRHDCPSTRHTQCSRKYRASHFCASPPSHKRYPSSSGRLIFWPCRQPYFPLSVPRWQCCPQGLDGLFPVVDNSWASRLNTPLLPTSTTTNNNAGQTVDLAVAKLIDLYGGSGNASTVPTYSAGPPRDMAAAAVSARSVSCRVALVGMAGAAVRSGSEDGCSSLGGRGASGCREREGGRRRFPNPAVLNDVATSRAVWLRILWLQEDTPKFEGIMWKVMAVMDEQALEAQGVAALGT
ncbi:hypothetical protein EDB83DRAFT_2519601 [Lactarius deliciosus]|nr:hypothetical protein EDB83DRAFT_2519601 [Lactarius deliciosus]